MSQDQDFDFNCESVELRTCRAADLCADAVQRESVAARAGAFEPRTG